MIQYNLEQDRDRILTLYADGYSLDEIGKIVAEERGRPVQIWAGSLYPAIARWVNKIDDYGRAS